MNKLKFKLLPLSIAVIFIGGLGLVGYKIVTNLLLSSHEKVLEIDFSELAKKGQVAYDDTCAACHGEGGVGTTSGPPFLHKVYHPGHHGDPSFVRAIKMGVKAHHWPFGDMPAQRHVSDDDIKSIIQYIRELQKANGIF